MDSLDLLTQPAYPAANHLQKHYDYGDQQQHQMGSADFSNSQFDYNASTTTTTECRLTNTSSRSSIANSSPEEQHQREITNSILTGHHINHQHNSNQTNENNTDNTTIQKIDQQVAKTTIASEGEEANDEDSFVAFCTDASSVLNNDPTRRYYINKLYQPMNGQQEDSSPSLVEQDDEYLLYQELRFLESTAQELTDERQRVQLTKILEDDEGDDDQLLAISSLNDEAAACQSEDDLLDRLQLTTMIEGFDSFPSSPLICHDRGDPLVIEASEHHQQDKPDSTRHSGQISPSSNSSSCTNSGQITTNGITSNSYNSSDNHHNHHHNHYQQQFGCDDQDDGQLQQFELSNQHHHQDDDENNQNHQFLSINPESHQHQHHHHLHHDNQHQCHNSHQMNKEDLSEISCFQSSVIPNFMPNTSVPVVTHQLEMFKSCETQQQQNHKNTAVNNNLPNTNTQSKKRLLQQADDGNDEASCDETNKSESRISIKNRTKKKRNSQTNSTQTADSSSKNSTATGSSKTMMLSDSKQSTALYSSNSKTNMTTTNNEYHDQHIIISQMKDHQNSDENLEDSNMSLDEDATSSAGGSGTRHASMSKYRRRTANARERIRMREINQAFEKLKKVVPIELIQQSMSGDESDQTSASSRRGASKSSNGQQQQGASADSQSVKLTKITTLRLAVSYIAKLSEVLNNHPECVSQAAGNSNIVANDNEAANSGSNSKIIKGKPGTDDKGSLTAKKRRGRTDSAAKKQTANEPSKGQTIKSVAEITVQAKQQSPLVPKILNATKQQGLSESSAQQPTNMLLNHQANNQGHPILIANNVINGQIRQHQTTTFLPIQQQQQNSSQSQFAYAQCNQQPVTISQTGNGQDRAFVTPLAVAILGIQGSNEQTLQLVGIQNAQQHPQQQQQQQHQASNGQYNLITTNNHQPQQVTLTLDDINGLSVLRLANPQTAMSHGQKQTIQLQQYGRPTIIQQPQTILATQNGGNQAPMAYQPQLHQRQQQQFNYATYQPIQISQVQQTPVRHMNSQQQVASIQLQDIGSGQDQNGMLQRSNSEFNEQQSSTFGANQLNDSTSSQMVMTAQTITTAIATTSTPTTTTGITSDCRSFGISPNMIAQHLNNNSNNNSNVVQTTQIKIQQSNCSGQIVQNGQLVAMPAGAQLFQAPSGSNASTISGQTNLIYINPPISLQGNTVNHHHQSQHFHQQVQQVQIQRDPMQKQKQQPQQIQLQCTANNIDNSSQLTISQQQQRQEGGFGFETTNSSPPLERMKFVTQFSSQTGVQRQDSSSKSDSEASIRQLVATLATSIHPKSNSKQSKTNNPPDQSNGDNQQRQQPKRTYRFHNYDGNMITNHLYNNASNNTDKQQQQQQQQTKKYQQQQPQTDQVSNNNASSQRSRQNSLSSTCSTTSSSSSSLASLSTASPLVGSIMIKSPTLESSNSSGSSLSAYPSTSAITTQSANETTHETPVNFVGSN